MILLAVTAVVLIVAVPPDSVPVPTDALVPVAIFSLFPDVFSPKFPLICTAPVLPSVTVPMSQLVPVWYARMFAPPSDMTTRFDNVRISKPPLLPVNAPIIEFWLPVVMALPLLTPINVLLLPDVSALAAPAPDHVLLLPDVKALPLFAPEPVLAIPFHATERDIQFVPVAVLLSPVE
jgi:hypothetical protein